MSANPSPGPLEGLRILDLSAVVMGPYATQILADYGADVVKVEPPGGDVMRKAGPMRSADMGPLHLQLNRNKRSLALDLKKDGGRRALLRLCRGADVLVHSARPAAMRRLRLGYEEVRDANPRIVYASLVGFGESGPSAGRPAYDDLIQGVSAVPWLFARAGADRPRYVPDTFSDRVVGLNAVHAILAALLARSRTGEGQRVEVPMFETVAQFVLGDHMGGRSFEPPIGPAGYSRLLAPDRRPYDTRDGHLCILLYEDKHWESFFRAIGREEEFRGDPRLHDHATRTRHYDEVYARLAEILRQRTTAEWIELLGDHDVPCGPLSDLDALIDDAHLRAVGFFQAVEHPIEGRLRLVGIPNRFGGRAGTVRRPPPRIGEHSVEVLREAGFEAAEIEALVAEGALVDGRTP